jgi:hypothetical protein
MNRFKYHNGINGANHWWGFIPFPFYKHESSTFTSSRELCVRTRAVQLC